MIHPSKPNQRYRFSISLALAGILLLLAACVATPGETPAPAQEATAAVEAYPEPAAGVPPAEVYPPVPAVPVYPEPLAESAYPEPAAEQSSEQTSPGIALADLPNLTYQIPLLAQALPENGSLVQLQDGRFEQRYPDSASGVQVSFIQGQTGDLNGDGVEDALAVLGVETGGSGTFIHLAALLAQDGTARPLPAVLLGDRIQVKSLDIQDGQAMVKMLTQGSDDPQCCPSEEVTRTFLLGGDLLLTPEQALVAPLAEQAIQALKNQDMLSLVTLVDAERGLRFSPYAYVQEDHQVFTPDQLANLLSIPALYTWGNYDGTGEPINLTFADYFQRFVYSKDFAAAEAVSFDQRLSVGNTIDNSREFYPDAIVVEYYLPGTDPQYGGMDWQSLRLVFQPVNDQWRLVAIIHDEWTI